MHKRAYMYFNFLISHTYIIGLLFRVHYTIVVSKFIRGTWNGIYFKNSKFFVESWFSQTSWFMSSLNIYTVKMSFKPKWENINTQKLIILLILEEKMVTFQVTFECINAGFLKKWQLQTKYVFMLHFCFAGIYRCHKS